MTDKEKVLAKYKEAFAISGPSNCNGHRIVLPLSDNNIGWEDGAWADAASRLEQPVKQEAEPTITITVAEHERLKARIKQLEKLWLDTGHMLIDEAKDPSKATS